LASSEEEILDLQADQGLHCPRKGLPKPQLGDPKSEKLERQLEELAMLPDVSEE